MSYQDILIALLIVLLGVILVVFVSTMRFKRFEGRIGTLLGLSEKNKILTFLGLGMGGILIALQALIASGQTKAMEDAVLKTEQGQQQERLKNAIEHLGDTSDSVRLSGVYELFHLAEDNKELGQTVLDILCAHIRWTTGESKYRAEHQSKPSEEIQSLLTLLFRDRFTDFGEFQDAGRPRINLRRSHLNGALLPRAWLSGVDLTGAQLQDADLTEAVLVDVLLYKANLTEAWLQRANLTNVRMQGAILTEARLQGAILAQVWMHEVDLTEARLQEAILAQAWLRGATLTNARLHEAHLGGAYLQGAVLTGARLQDAILAGAQLQGATLAGAQLQEADLMEADLRGAGIVVIKKDGDGISSRFAERVRGRINQKSDFSGSIFAGGLSQKDVDAIVEGLSGDKAERLRQKLNPHIGKEPSYELPENSGAITGAYTAEEAEQWIAEYERAMSEVPRSDS